MGQQREGRRRSEGEDKDKGKIPPAGRRDQQRCQCPHQRLVNSVFKTSGKFKCQIRGASENINCQIPSAANRSCKLLWSSVDIRSAVRTGRLQGRNDQEHNEENRLKGGRLQFKNRNQDKGKDKNKRKNHHPQLKTNQPVDYPTHSNRPNQSPDLEPTPHFNLRNGRRR